MQEVCGTADFREVEEQPFAVNLGECDTLWERCAGDVVLYGGSDERLE